MEAPRWEYGDGAIWWSPAAAAGMRRALLANRVLGVGVGVFVLVLFLCVRRPRPRAPPPAAASREPRTNRPIPHARGAAARRLTTSPPPGRPRSIVCLLGCVVSSKTDYPTYARIAAAAPAAAAARAADADGPRARPPPRPRRLGYGVSMVVFGIVALVLLGSPRESEGDLDPDRERDKTFIPRMLLLIALCAGVLAALGMLFVKHVVRKNYARPLSFRKDVMQQKR